MTDRRPPDLSGRAGRAWLVPHRPVTKDHEASVAGWLVNVPGANAFWQWWSVGCLSLRDIEGVPPAHKQYPEAEYEFLILSLDPQRCPEPDVDHPENGYSFLEPPDVVLQFHGVSERDAKRITESCIRAIVEGTMSPDQDWRLVWRRVLAGTVAHYRAGKHPEH